jgi:hypothetical protein
MEDKDLTTNEILELYKFSITEDTEKEIKNLNESEALNFIFTGFKDEKDFNYYNEFKLLIIKFIEDYSVNNGEHKEEIIYKLYKTLKV